MKNLLVYNSSYKTLIVAKPLHIRLDKLDGFIRVYEAEKYDFIYHRIRCLIGIKSGITYVISLCKNHVDSYNSLPLKKH